MKNLKTQFMNTRMDETADLRSAQTSSTSGQSRQEISGTRWEEIEGTKICAPLSCWNDFVISHRPGLFVCCYRPAGRHIHIGNFKSIKEAKRAAVSYIKNKKELEATLKIVGMYVSADQREAAHGWLEKGLKESKAWLGSGVLASQASSSTQETKS